MIFSILLTCFRVFGYPWVVISGFGSGFSILQKVGFGYPRNSSGRVGFSGNRVPVQALVSMFFFSFISITTTIIIKAKNMHVNCVISFSSYSFVAFGRTLYQELSFVIACRSNMKKVQPPFLHELIALVPNEIGGPSTLLL